MTNYDYSNHDNSSNCWSIKPWDIVLEHKLHKVLERQDIETELVRFSRSSENWEQIKNFPHLEEIHVFDATEEQLNFISNLEGIKRLILESCRPKDISFLTKMQTLEELSFDAVSGFDDLSPLSHLTNLKALKLHILRRVKDFSSLSTLSELRFLFLGGNFEFPQPVSDLKFLTGNENLEYLIFDNLKVIEKEWPALPIASLKNLKYIELSRNTFSFENFALLEVALKGVAGADFQPVIKEIHFFHGNEGWLEAVPWQVPDTKIDHIDIHRSLSPGIRTASGAILALDGLTDIGEPSSKEGYLDLIGRGSRGFRSDIKNAEKRCLAHITKYEEAKKTAKIILEVEGYL